MRVFFFFDETVFYHPQMLETLLRDSRHEWVGLGLSPHDRLGEYFWRNAAQIGYLAGAKLIYRKYSALLKDKLRFSATPLTLQAVARKYNLSYSIVPEVNDKTYIKYLKSLDIDVIVSSGLQIFKPPLLSLPKIACINRHSALLPAHGGMLPVFQAIAAGDRETGVSIHIMDDTIDTGPVIIQRAISIPKYPVLSDIYEECFVMSAELILQALEILENSLPFQLLPDPDRQPSYHSYPSAEDWLKFKKRNGRFA
ncbi:MAG: hypothetical protein LBJ14_00745 [Desulfarculales bacterium]|jgi:methionyl-tRNA formyltransferase|nr:hypothetical protein [Desulfarculales bacterium]